LTKEPLKWAVELSEFDITFHPHPALKSQVLADFVAESSVPTTSQKSEVDDRWLVYMNGATSYKGSRIRVTMIGTQGEAVNYALQLLFMASNNVEEYDAFLIGLRFAKGIGAR
jgi:hypothetical protein